MEGRHGSYPEADAVPAGVVERMDRADALVRPWVDPAFRAQIDPDTPEVVGPPASVYDQRIRRRT